MRAFAVVGPPRTAHDFSGINDKAACERIYIMEGREAPGSRARGTP
jgi:hypothetical protein